ncbi:hypothetical protein [Neorhizobium alkalisoli]|jgi:hypothetical protein|uniref:DUF4352 domain-containing protein n=1 Tax=Neorhizobium alkalisoli TaxID=528178 RepID=A0A561QBD5_9HYPH|nr:hypothetical protein [Neorhizobium alkalisoli]TWF47651.1 hypothetical protein FHW37_111154 [Neorhizobium alkalisoli]
MIRFLATIIGILTAAALLQVFQATTPGYAQLTGPILTSGAQKDTVSSQTFSVRIDKAVQAKTLVLKRFSRTIERQTQGTWLVVSAELWAFQETMPLAGASIRGASGRLYVQTHRADAAPQLLSLKKVQPGLPTTGILVFELPEEEATDMTLILSKQASPRLEDEVHVHLDRGMIESRDKVEPGNGGI